MQHCKTTPSGPYPRASQIVLRKSSEHDSPQTASRAYRLAFQDPDFMLRPELRSARIQLEMIKPELILEEQGVESTIVIYGSTRIIDPDTAQARVSHLQTRLEADKQDRQLRQELKKARKDLEKSKYYEEARRLGNIISSYTSAIKPVVITGGGPGIMEAANRGAQDVQAQSIGLNIVLEQEQVPNRFVSPELCFQFHYFATRKMHFLIRSKGLVAFPGGFGTLDEIFETLTLVQVQKIRPVPVVLFGRKFWDRVINFQALVEEGVIDQKDLELFEYAETAEQAWKIIAAFNCW